MQTSSPVGQYSTPSAAAHGEERARNISHTYRQLLIFPNLMLIDDADRPAKWYFALKSALRESRRTGAEMVHPMSGPVTLRWRS